MQPHSACTRKGFVVDYSYMYNVYMYIHMVSLLWHIWLIVVVVVVVSQFNGTSTPKGSYSAKTGDNDCNVNLHDLSRYSLSTALCESNSLSGQV